MSDDTQIIPDNTASAPEQGSEQISSGDGSAPVKPENWEKIDPNKLSPEELKHYKFFQGHFTKATQKFANEKNELTGKLSNYESLLSDNIMSPLAYYRQNGRLPDGVDAGAFVQNLSQQLGVKQNPPDGMAQQQSDGLFNPDAPYIDENTQKYIDSKIAPLMQKLQMAESFVGNEVKQKASTVVSSFRENLAKKDPELGSIFDKYAANGKLKDALQKVPSNIDKMDDALKFAFNALAGEEYAQIVAEKTRSQVMEELKNKDLKDRPITGGSTSAVKPVSQKDLRKLLADEFDKVGS